MSIVFVNERPNPIVRAGDGPGILFNRSSTLPLYIGSDSSIVNGNYNSASILDPMSSVFIGGDVDIWACAPVGTSVDNAIPVDYIHSGRSQHYTSPVVLKETINGIPDTIGTSVGTNLLPVLQEILTAIQALSTGSESGGGSGNGGGTVTPTVTGLQANQGATWQNYAASGTRAVAATGSFTVPANATGIIFMVNANGQMTDIAGIMVEIQYTIDSATAVIIPVQTGYQGGQATLSGNYSQVIPVSGATTVNYSVLITCTTGTWTVNGTVNILCQIGS